MYPPGALTRLGLARAYTLQKDTVRARAAYQDLMGICKDADPDVPEMPEAKTEFMRLQ